MIGKSIGQAEIRKTTGASVVGVLRRDQLLPNPDAAFIFEAADLVAIIGAEEARSRFERLIEPSSGDQGGPGRLTSAAS